MIEVNFRDMPEPVKKAFAVARKPLVREWLRMLAEDGERDRVGFIVDDAGEWLIGAAPRADIAGALAGKGLPHAAIERMAATPGDEAHAWLIYFGGGGVSLTRVRALDGGEN